MTGRLWLNTTQAAEIADRHVDTVLVALQTGELDGGQRKKGGRWRIHRDCLDAWLRGERCEHQKSGAA